MSPDYAAATRNAVMHWGHYAEIFAYHVFPDGNGAACDQFLPFDRYCGNVRSRQTRR